MEIVGKIRFRTIHTNTRTCVGPTEDNTMKCHESTISGGTVNRTDLGVEEWEIFRTESDAQESLSITGEFTTFTGEGFIYDFDPSISSTSFQDQIALMESTFFN